MGHVSALITLPLEESGRPITSTEGLTGKHISLLWERMAMIYGHRWVSSYGERDDGTWLKGLHDVTPDQVGVGLEKCRTSGDEWPPTLPIFRDRCLPEKKEPLPLYLRDERKEICAFVSDGKCRGNVCVRICEDAWLCEWHYENRYDDVIREAVRKRHASA